jgi:acetoin utilization protein AcuB
MTFWIYNYGLAVPLSEQGFKIDRKTSALTKLSKSNRVNDWDKPELDTLSTEPSTLVSALNMKYSSYEAPKKSQVFHSEDIMSTPVKTLNDKTNLEDARQQFDQYRYRHFPVLNNKKRLVGMVSDRDLIKAMSFITEKSISPTSKTITDIMSKRVFTASDRVSIRECCLVMFKHHVGALPITDEIGGLLGIITRSDILRSLIENEPLELWV